MATETKIELPENAKDLILFKVYLEKEEDGLTISQTEFAPAFTAEEIQEQVENVKDIVPATADEEAAYRNGFHSGVEFGLTQITIMDNTALNEEA